MSRQPDQVCHKRLLSRTLWRMETQRCSRRMRSWQARQMRGMLVKRRGPEGRASGGNGGTRERQTLLQRTARPTPPQSRLDLNSRGASIETKSRVCCCLKSLQTSAARLTSIPVLGDMHIHIYMQHSACALINDTSTISYSVSQQERKGHYCNGSSFLILTPILKKAEGRTS